MPATIGFASVIAVLFPKRVLKSRLEVCNRIPIVIFLTVQENAGREVCKRPLAAGDQIEPGVGPRSYNVMLQEYRAAAGGLDE